MAICEVEISSGDFGKEIIQIEATTKGELRRKIDAYIDAAEKRNGCAFITCDWWVKGTR